MPRATPGTILNLQSDIENALQRLAKQELPAELRALSYLAPPNGMRAAVSLRNRNDRQVKKTAAADNWTPVSGTINICFREADADKDPPAVPAKADPVREDPLRDLIFALDRAERDPHVSFVSLKWFRDKRLPELAGSWAASQEARQEAIVKAIQSRWVLTSKVPNPKTPQFPVTAIRLNRAHPEVREKLLSAPSEFEPIVIRGEPLSETILRERR